MVGSPFSGAKGQAEALRPGRVAGAQGAEAATGLGPGNAGPQCRLGVHCMRGKAGRLVSEEPPSDSGFETAPAPLGRARTNVPGGWCPSPAEGEATRGRQSGTS